MKIELTGEPKEIADFIQEMQGKRECTDILTKILADGISIKEDRTPIYSFGGCGGGKGGAL